MTYVQIDTRQCDRKLLYDFENVLPILVMAGLLFRSLSKFYPAFLAFPAIVVIWQRDFTLIKLHFHRMGMQGSIGKRFLFYAPYLIS